MAVVIETTLGDITVDLYLEQRPVTCLNFLKLCKMKYYNYNLFHSIRSGFIAQTGDPSGEGSGGQSIWGILEGPDKRFFSGEKMPKIRHTDAGLLSMVCTEDMMVGSQFFLTLAPDLDSLDGTHCVIGEVTEGHEVLTKLNEVICDETHRPYRDVRITHTVVLEDPFNDPAGLRAPSRSPSPNAERLKGGRIAPDEEIDETQGKSAAEIQEIIEEKEAKARATILEIVGDLPDAEIAPPENVLFVCKLNPVTTDEDLEIIFSRFGKIVSCEVIRDKKTGNSLQYAFIEFDNKKACEDAYFKMDNVLIDDRRIHVDFSQSVSKMRWLGKGRGVQYFDDDTKVSNSRDNTNRREKQYDRTEDNSSRNRQENDERRRDRDHKYERKRDKDSNNRDRNNRSPLGYSQSKLVERDQDKYSKDDKREKDKKTSERNHDRHSKDNVRERDRPSERERTRYSNNSTRNSEKYANDIKESEHRPSERKQERYLKDNSRDNDKRYSERDPDRHSKELRENDNRSSERDNDSNNKYNRRNNHTNSHKSFYSSKDEHISKSIENDRYSDRQRYQNKRKHENNEFKAHKKTRKEDDENNSSHVEDPKTPSPMIIKKQEKDTKQKNKLTNNDKKKQKKDKAKKRKQSTSSSDSDSSTSSSSSESTSSSSSSEQKKKSKRKKRKYSTSSSSESSSSSSSSSSDSSDSSSSSDDKRSKNKHKNSLRKSNRKIKKKL